MDVAHEIGMGRVGAVDAEAGRHAELFNEIGEAAGLGDGEGGIDPGVDGGGVIRDIIPGEAQRGGRVASGMEKKVRL